MISNVGLNNVKVFFHYIIDTNNMCMVHLKIIYNYAHKSYNDTAKQKHFIYIHACMFRLLKTYLGLMLHHCLFGNYFYNFHKS